jgi:hypothetical protein
VKKHPVGGGGELERYPVDPPHGIGLSGGHSKIAMMR